MTRLRPARVFQSASVAPGGLYQGKSSVCAHSFPALHALAQLHVCQGFGCTSRQSGVAWVYTNLGVHESLPAGLGSLLTRLTLNRALDLQTRRPHLASEELVVAVCPSVLETRAKGWQRSRSRVPGSSGTGWWEPLAEDTAVPLFAEPGRDRAGMHNNGQALTLPLELT